MIPYLFDECLVYEWIETNYVWTDSYLEYECLYTMNTTYNETLFDEYHQQNALTSLLCVPFTQAAFRTYNYTDYLHSLEIILSSSAIPISIPYFCKNENHELQARSPLAQNAIINIY